jgi:hypothetical protein
MGVEIKITRDIFTLQCTIGKLEIVGSAFTCYTLEDVARAIGVKIYGQTAIPEGEYKFTLSRSPKFGRVLPLIFNNEATMAVEDGRGVRFTGVRMHNGVNHKNTEGCVLCGFERNETGIWKPATDELMNELRALEMKNGDYGKIIITNKQTTK